MASAQMLLSEEEINDQLSLAMDEPNRFPGMSYSDGVQAALSWVLGNTSTPQWKIKARMLYHI